jgi:hypothetical protein
MEINATLQCVPELGFGHFPEPGKSSLCPRIPMRTEFSIVLPPKLNIFKVSLRSKYSKQTLYADLCPTQFILLNSTTIKSLTNIANRDAPHNVIILRLVPSPFILKKIEAKFKFEI